MPTVAAYCILCHCGSKTLSILKDQLASFRIEELVSSVLIEKKKERVELDSRSYTRNSMNNAFCWAWLKKTLSVGPHGCRPCYSCPRTRLQILIISYDGNHEALYLFLLFVIKGLNSLKLSRRISAPAFKKKISS
jgi:protein-arginine kinase activator protein McsA